LRYVLQLAIKTLDAQLYFFEGTIIDWIMTQLSAHNWTSVHDWTPPPPDLVDLCTKANEIQLYGDMVVRQGVGGV
jgi:hypothetical protein